MSADLYFIGASQCFFFLSFFLFAALSPRSLNGTQRKSATWSEVSVIWKRMSEIWDTSSHYKSGAQNHLFWTTSQLNGKFNGLYLRNETRYRQSVKCVDNYKVSPTSCQNVMNIGPQTASNSTTILPTLRKFCIQLHCQASQTDISKRNSTKLCQVMGSKSP